MIVPASHFEKTDDGKVVCLLCPLQCVLTDGKSGVCQSRFNKEGELISDNYGELVTMAVDPIEKKPLYHFYPGSSIFSTGPNSCNLGCRHCQNWTISQQVTRTRYVSPEELIAAAVASETLGVAFTYTEPMVWFEYIMECAPKLRQAGLKVVLVTNGFVNPQPLAEMISVCDAMNIDLKSMNEEFYKKICKGTLEPVLNSIRTVGESDCHLEVTNLIIPGENDSEEEIVRMVDFIASVSPMTPLHLSAYHPAYRMSVEATSSQLLEMARDRAREKLAHVYIGNVHVSGGSDTFCAKCGNLLIERSAHSVNYVGLKKNRCAACDSVAELVV